MNTCTICAKSKCQDCERSFLIRACSTCLTQIRPKLEEKPLQEEGHLSSATSKVEE
jgi:hypothetical protein